MTAPGLGASSGTLILGVSVGTVSTAGRTSGVFLISSTMATRVSSRYLVRYCSSSSGMARIFDITSGSSSRLRNVAASRFCRSMPDSSPTRTASFSTISTVRPIWKEPDLSASRTVDHRIPSSVRRSILTNSLLMSKSSPPDSVRPFQTASSAAYGSALLIATTLLPEALSGTLNSVGTLTGFSQKNILAGVAATFIASSAENTMSFFRMNENSPSGDLTTQPSIFLNLCTAACQSLAPLMMVPSLVAFSKAFASDAFVGPFVPVTTKMSLYLLFPRISSAML